MGRLKFRLVGRDEVVAGAGGWTDDGPAAVEEQDAGGKCWLVGRLKFGTCVESVGDSDFQCRQLGRDLPGSMQVKGTPNPNFRKVDAVVYDENRQVIVRVSTVVPRF